MISSLDSNLVLQVITVLPSILIFALVLEGFGYVLLKILSPILRRFDGSTPTTNGIVRIFVGGLFYTLVFLALGELRLLFKPLVLGVSVAVPILAFVVGRRWKELNRDRVRTILNDNKYIILGTIAFGLMTFIFWFRPIVNFDSVWYHLTIPKLFLQNHDTRNQGGLLLYSLQPSMDYFWNLWPLSLPASTAVSSIMVSGIHALFVCLGLGYTTSIGKKMWGWNRGYQFIVPILVGFTFEGVSLFGIGGNDLLGMAYGVVASLYCFYVLSKPKLSWSQLTIGLLLIVGAATIKIFFTVFAGLILVYLLAGAWSKLPDIKQPKKQLLRLVGLLLVTFIFTYLPWLIRAYLATGRPLDPMGVPGLTEQFYIDQGGGTALREHGQELP